MTTYAAALEAFLALRTGWEVCPCFRDGAVAAMTRAVDARVAAGAAILPVPDRVFAALAQTPRDAVRAVIIGQDPYPNRLNAMGLAFSVPRGRPIPPSLRTVHDALAADLSHARPGHGDLTAWTRRGVLLLNAALTVEEGRPNSHATLKPGWSALLRDVVAALAASQRPVTFLLWGGFAQTYAAGIDPARHDVIESRHPSTIGLPADARGPNHPFVRSRPFARARDAALARGLPPLDWSLD